MEPTTITLVLPGMLDGDTPEVDALTRQAIWHAMDEFAEWVDDAIKQMANAERSRILDREPLLNAEALDRKYQESDTAGQLRELSKAARGLVGAAADLTR